MPNVPFIPGSDTSQAAAENLRTRLLVADAWIELAARPDGAHVREIEQFLSKFDSGPSARQGELANQAGVLRKHAVLRREKCAVYFLADGLTVATAKARYRNWLQTDGKKKPSRQRLPAAVAEACEDAADVMRHTADDNEIDKAMKKVREAIRSSM